MKRLLRAAARLYPRAWRDRYGDEFDALIDDLTPRWRDVFNVVIRALIMHTSRLTLTPVALAIVGAVLGAAVSLTLPPVYASFSQVLVRVPELTTDGSEREQRVQRAINAALRDTVADKKSVRVTLHGEGDRDQVVLEVSASADSARAAKQATEKVVASMIDANFVASERRPQAGAQFRVVGPANLPTTGQRNITRNSAVGGGIGLVIGAVVAFAEHRRRRAAA